MGEIEALPTTATGSECLSSSSPDLQPPHPGARRQTVAHRPPPRVMDAELRPCAVDLPAGQAGRRCGVCKATLRHEPQVRRCEQARGDMVGDHDHALSQGSYSVWPGAGLYMGREHTRSSGRSVNSFPTSDRVAILPKTSRTRRHTRLKRHQVVATHQSGGKARRCAPVAQQPANRLFDPVPPLDHAGASAPACS
jgi:hypothetical protein